MSTATRRMSRQARREYYGSRKGQQRAAAEYRFKAADLAFGDERFSFIAYSGGKFVTLGDQVTSCSWADEDAEDGGLPGLAGTMAIMVPDLMDGEDSPVQLGTLIICKVARGEGRSREYWRMRVASLGVQLPDGSREVTLESAGKRLQRTKDDWKYTAKKNKNKKGWLCHQIVRHAAREHRINIAPRGLAEGKHRIEKLNLLNKSFLELVRAAYDKEAKATGKRFLVDYRNGLRVQPLRFPSHMLLLGDAIISAQLQQSMQEKFATVLSVRATVAKSRTRKKKKINITVKDRKAIKRHGFIHREVNLSNVKSEADARRKAKRMLAKELRPVREVSFTHPGILRLRRFDALRVTLRDEGFHEVVWVKSVTHTVTAGVYECEVTVQFGDPMADERKRRAKRKKCMAAKRRGRKLPKGCPGAEKDKDKDDDDSERAKRKRQRT